MRLLSVPSHLTQLWIERCKEQQWLRLGVSVHRLDEDRRGIPLSDDAPSGSDEYWEGHPVLEVDDEVPQALRWSEYLPEHIRSLPGEPWPSSFEIQGDILMVKFDDEQYKQEIAEAMLQHFKNIRIVCADRGVKGDFRVRDLEILASKDGTESTKTYLREHGVLIQTNPGDVYYSSRLAHERERSAERIGQFKEKKQRKLVIADLYAGVGPAFGLLFQHDLVAGYIANDLNPHAIPHLRMNLAHFTKKSEPLEPARIECCDARTLARFDGIEGSADVLLVNLPHESLDHLTDLIACLKPSETTLVRGWCIVERSELSTIKQRIEHILREHGKTTNAIDIEEVKGYSTTKVVASFTFEVCIADESLT